MFELREGIDARRAARELLGCATQGRNVTSAGPFGVLRLRDQYLNWVEQTEIVLANIFARPELVGLQSDRFWRIRDIDEDSARPFDLVRAEANYQAAHLDSVAKELLALDARFGDSEATVAVPDTNVFLHFRPFEQVPWLDLLSAEEVMLVVPIAIVQELDHLRSSRDNRLRRRAQKVLTRLEPLLSRRSEVAHGVAIESLIDDDLGLSEAGSSDSRILDVCKALKAIVGKRVVLVTGDVAMRVRASALGLRATAMPDSERLPLADNGE